MLSAAPSQALHQTPLAGLGNAFPAPGHCPEARSSFKPHRPRAPTPAAPWLPGEEVQAPKRRSKHQAQHAGRKAEAEIREEPSYMKHKANALLGPYTRACSRQEEHHVQGVVQAGHPQPQLKMSSQTRLYSPQKGEILPGPSKWPGCRGQTSPIPQRDEDGGGPNPPQPPLLPTSGQCCGELQGWARQRRGAQAAPLPGMPPRRVVQSQPWIQHGQGLAASPVPGSTMHHPHRLRLLGTCGLPHPPKESKHPTCHSVGHQALQIQGLFC